MLRAFRWSQFVQRFGGERRYHSESLSSKNLSISSRFVPNRQRQTFISQLPIISKSLGIRYYATFDEIPGLTRPADPEKLMNIQPDFVIPKETLSYVQMLFLLGGRIGKLQEIYEDFKVLSEVESYFREILRMPFMDNNEKKKFIDRLAKVASFRKCSILLIKALIDWNVDKLMDKIVQDFVRLVKFYKKERELIITTNRPLTPQELEHYKQTFKVTYFTPDSFVTIVNQVDPSISRGYRLEIDGRISLDFTLDKQRDEAVKKLREKLDEVTELIKKMNK